MAKKTYVKPSVGIMDLRAFGLMDVGMTTNSVSVPANPEDNTEENGSFSKETLWDPLFSDWDEQ